MFIILQQTWFSFHCEITLHPCHLLQAVTNQIVIIINQIIIIIIVYIPVIREIIQGRNWTNFCVKAVLSVLWNIAGKSIQNFKTFLFSVLLLKIIKRTVFLSWLLKYPKLGMFALYKGTDFQEPYLHRWGCFQEEEIVFQWMHLTILMHFCHTKSWYDMVYLWVLLKGSSADNMWLTRNSKTFLCCILIFN